MVPVMARFGEARRQGRYGQQGGGNQKLGFGHRDSPEVLLETTHFQPFQVPFSAKWQEKLRENYHSASIFGRNGCLTNYQHSPARVLRSGHPVEARLSSV
jgi:hypothetical protein